MKHLRRFEDEESSTVALYLLRDNGIPTHTTSSVKGSYQLDVHVILDHQYDDAVRLLEDPTHEVANPVDMNEFDRLKNHPAILDTIVKWALLCLVAAAVLAGAVFYLAARMTPPSSNHSLERSVLAPRAVPAVPLVGCTACPSINGRVAAAQFNR